MGSVMGQHDNITDSFPLADLPEDILLNIISYLPASEIVKTCRRVSHQWQQLADTQKLWHDKCEREIILSTNPHAHPKDFRKYYFLRPFDRNLIKNPCGGDGLDHWEILDNGGNGIRVEKQPKGSKSLEEAFPDQDIRFCWATSYRDCTKSQTVDLIKEGCTECILDEIKPEITVSEWYSARWDCGSVYSLKVDLLNEEKEVLDNFSFSDNIQERSVWHKVEHTFVDYPEHVRFVTFTHTGTDTQFWAGHYGSKFTLANLRLSLASNS